MVKKVIVPEELKDVVPKSVSGLLIPDKFCACGADISGQENDECRTCMNKALAIELEELHNHQPVELIVCKNDDKWTHPRLFAWNANEDGWCPRCEHDVEMNKEWWFIRATRAEDKRKAHNKKRRERGR